MTVPPPTFVSQRFRSPAGPPLTLASDLTVPLAEVRLLAPDSDEPDRGVPCRVDLALVHRARLPSDPPAAATAGRPGVSAAVMVRPCLHTPVELGRLAAAYAHHLDGAELPALSEVLLPRPPGRSLRVPERLPAGWAEPRPPGTPRRAGIACLHDVLVEHPGWLEREIDGPRAKGGVLDDGWSRAAALPDPGASGAAASLPSLAGELALLLPDGNAAGPRSDLPGAPAAGAPRFVLSLLEAAWAAGDGRPEVARAVEGWAGASDRWKAREAGELRERTRVGLRSLWPRVDGRRRRIRSVQPALVELLGCARRPFPQSLLWGGEGGHTEAALVSTAELLWSALWSPWLVETLQVAVGEPLGRARWLWGDGSAAGFVRAAQEGGFSVAQVVVPVGHGLHRRAAGALDLPNPRGAWRDWRGRWACPSVRREQSTQALTQPVHAVLAGPAPCPGALVDTLWGTGDWPVAFGARLSGARVGVA